MESQYVVIELAGESYGVAIDRVQEIDRMTAITAIPESPSFVEGVINLRGRITPVVNLRCRFGLPKAAATAQTRIVVAKSGVDWVGLVVDGVSEVVRIPADAVEPTPSMATATASAFMHGIAKFGDRLIILLDLECVLEKALKVCAPVTA
jgi:purine-binding chemotaxis protein CheW